MKKSVKRILCGALSIAMCSTMVLEGALRLTAEKQTASTTASASTTFTNVTGQYDTSKLREQYFNSSVVEAEDTAPVYETRTVMVTLSGKNMVERSGDGQVADYLGTWSGDRAMTELEKEQSAFLQALSKKGIAYEIEHTYANVLNAVAIKVDTKYVSEIKKMSGVDSVVITTSYEVPQTVQTQSSHSDVVTNETEVYETGIYDSSKYAAKYGEGMVVAVLDTGLDYTHAAFQQFQSSSVDVRWTKNDVKNLINTKNLAAEVRSGSLEVSDVYMNDKVPFAYDYADDDADVYPSYSNHGTHVAGIIGGYDPSGYTDKDGNPITDKEFLGVVPDAQLMICKVFTDDLDDPDLGGAVSEDIVAALEDCVTLGVDVINMSLGSSCGFTTTDDGDDEGEMLNEVYESIGKAGISLICAASNDYSAGYGGVYGTNLAENPDAGTVGSPSTYASALSVASINGQAASYLVIDSDSEEIDNPYVFFEEARDINSNELDFVGGLNELYPSKNGEFEYVVVPGTGSTSDFSSVASLFRDKNNPRIALVKRGDSTFKEKVEAAKGYGAAGIIVYNNVAGMIRMNLGEVDEPIPAISISLNAGNAMVAGAVNKVGKISINEAYAAGPFMSEFSSWGPTPDLRLKPEITAHGGEITSAVPGGYGEQSGTSMATPNMAGFMAIVRSYIQDNSAFASLIKKDNGSGIDSVKVNRLAMQLTMSTAGMVYDQDELPYSPRKQGAGVAKLDNVIEKTTAFLSTDSEENDYRPKIELGDDKEKTGEYTLKFKVTNFGTKTLSFALECQFMTETISSNHLTVDEQAHMLTDSSVKWSGEGVSNGKVTIEKGKTKEITAVLTLGDEDRAYIEDNFKNGMYVEGFINLISTESNGNQCDLVLPFMGFYGDWDAAPMLDYSVYEVAENAQDSSVLERDKIKASVWETQPYNMYYNDKYILPMGSYVYLLPDDIADSEKMYANEEYNSVSRYNEYYGEGESTNYMTSTGIKAVYAGLLRNARYVKYRLIDESTGEVLKSDYMNRVSKAYAGGGSAVPANVELELLPEEEGLLANGRYRMEFEFFSEGYKYTGDDAGFEAYLDSLTADEENTFNFSFTVDYDAPVMEDARVRFYNYKDGKVEKQKVYLDIDVYDNHYAQTVMLCYPKKDAQGDLVLQLATEYPTPVRNAVKNGVTTVSIEITDIYEEYGDNLYIQLDDYALNTCLYQIDAKKAKTSVLPAANDFALAEGEGNISLDIYGTHKVSLVYGEEYTDKVNLSNFTWRSADANIADVKNGEIVGLSEGTTYITVMGSSGAPKTITVNVSGNQAELVKVPDITLGVIKTDTEALEKAEGSVEVSAGKTFTVNVISDPWYHPMTGLDIVWSSSNPEIATVDSETGEITTIKEGSTNISATIYQNGQNTRRSAYVKLFVQDDYTVSNYTLTDYNGIGYTVDDAESTKKLPAWDTPLTAEDGILRIPTYLNVMYIGAEAFKDNNNIKTLIIPSSVIEIRERAFLNCTALEEVYFVSTDEREIADADVSMIYENAFEGCINLKKISFVNVKTVTIAADCFKDCSKLAVVEGMNKIGTMHHRAFAGTALTEVDLTGLHMSGDNVFSGCESLTSVITGKFTAIGNGMFSEYKPYGAEVALYPACTSLETVTLHTPKIGDGAFAGCTSLEEVIFDSQGEDIEFAVGANAFQNSGLEKVYFGSKTSQKAQPVRAIGDYAFAGTWLSEFNFNMVKGLEILGENAFANTSVTQVTISDDMDFENLRLTGIPFNAKLSVKVASSSTKYSQDSSGVIYNKAQTKILYVPATLTGTYVVNSSVTEIGDYAFGGTKVSSVTLHSGVTEIGVGAFKNAQLTSIDFSGASISEIPESAFDGAYITSITLPNTVKKLGAYAFANSHLTKFVGTGVSTMENYAFADCKVLKNVSLGSGNVTLGDGVFRNTAIEKITLPSVKEMGVGTFVGADKLKEVTFGNNSTTTGEYTFAFTPVEKVVIGNATQTIGYAAFYGCEKLQSIDVKNVIEIEAQAFEGCSSLTEVTNIENATSFGARSFYNTKLDELALTSAKYIGVMAFAFESENQNETAAYTRLTLPAVEIIEDYAFFNGGIESVELPASLQKMGAGVFGASDNLTTITVAEENKIFFVEGGVLYRNVDKAKTVYELVFYPTALEQKGEKGQRTYTVKEGTARILAYSFAQINKDAVNAVVLPYSVKIVGDGAFFNSGITTYTFESIQAPILESSYNATIREGVNMNNVESKDPAEYKGYYYMNFDSEFYLYSSKWNLESPLTMYYPRNGSGYTNPIYARYFGTKIASSADLKEDNTRLCISYIDNLKTVDEILGWMNGGDEEVVKEYANHMKAVRECYNSVITNSVQAEFISDWRVERLREVEDAMRTVKEYFGLISDIDYIEVAADSAHKTEYKKGEDGDITGLKAIIVYEDGSREEADSSLFVLETTSVNTYTKSLTVSYEGKKFYVDIKVLSDETQNPTTSTDSGSSATPDKKSNTIVVIVAVVADVAIVGLAVFLYMQYRKGKATKNTAEAENKAEDQEKASSAEEKQEDAPVEEISATEEVEAEQVEDNSDNQ